MRLLSTLLFASVIASAENLPINVKLLDDRIQLTIDGKPYTDFYFKGPEVTKPYLWPLRAPSGTEVTRKFPMEPNTPAEPHDHPHHRGLWFAHEKVNGVDFWNNDASYTSPPPRGRIVLQKITKMKSGTHAVIGVDLAWNDPDRHKLLQESRTMTFSATNKLRIIDVNILLTASADVTLGDAKDGTFGIRLNPLLEEDKNVKEDGKTWTIPGEPGLIVNAEGVKHEKEVWGKPSDWVDYSGVINGEKVGIAILDHPSNSRRARWHVRAYGLFAANPFGDSVFSSDKSHDGTVHLSEGQLLHFRYRVIVHPGDSATANIAKQWDEFVRSKPQS